MRVAGIGFRKDAPLSALRAVLAEAERLGGPVNGIATIQGKADSAVLVALARERGLPISSVAVAGVVTPTQSERVQAMHGTGSVAEAAALVAAGQGSIITVRRVSSVDGMATAAIAESKGEKA